MRTVKALKDIKATRRDKDGVEFETDLKAEEGLGHACSNGACHNLAAFMAIEGSDYRPLCTECEKGYDPETDTLPELAVEVVEEP